MYSVNSQTTNYTYNQLNQLVDYNGVAQYKYGGNGLRMQKVQGGSTQNFAWDIAAGLPLLLQDGSASFIYGPGGMPLEEVTNAGSAYYYHTDQLGSIRALTDGSGNVANSYNYDAYGKVSSSIGSVYNPFGYTGQYTDTESGLIYLRARYYDPSTQQFLSVDPLVGITGQAYNYVGGSPTNTVDPMGLSPRFRPPYIPLPVPTKDPPLIPIPTPTAPPTPSEDELWAQSLINGIIERANIPDWTAPKSGLTRSGNALKKHVNRKPNSPWAQCAPSGLKAKAAEWNAAGDATVKDILSNAVKVERRERANYGWVWEFFTSDGRGIRVSALGNSSPITGDFQASDLIGFLDP